MRGRARARYRPSPAPPATSSVRRREGRELRSDSGVRSRLRFETRPARRDCRRSPGRRGNLWHGRARRHRRSSAKTTRCSPAMALPAAKKTMIARPIRGQPLVRHRNTGARGSRRPRCRSHPVRLRRAARRRRPAAGRDRRRSRCRPANSGRRQPRRRLPRRVPADRRCSAG